MQWWRKMTKNLFVVISRDVWYDKKTTDSVIVHLVEEGDSFSTGGGSYGNEYSTDVYVFLAVGVTVTDVSGTDSKLFAHLRSKFDDLGVVSNEELLENVYAFLRAL